MRRSRNDAAMVTAFSWALCSSCCCFKVGAVLISSGDHRVIGVGYNGGVSGSDHCVDVGCTKLKLGPNGERQSCIALHAEDNAIAHADSSRLKGSTLFVTIQPCLNCAIKIAQYGISEVVAGSEYKRIIIPGDGRHDDSAQAMRYLDEHGVKFRWYSAASQEVADEIERYQQCISEEVARFRTGPESSL